MGRATILMLGGVLLIGGCNRDAANALIGKPSAKPKASALANKGPNADQQTAGMTIAVGIGKATLPAQLKFGLASRPKLGEAVDVDIALLPQIPADGGTLQVTATDGLDTSKAQTEIALPALDEGAVYHQTLSVTPSKDGVLLLAFNVTLKHDEIEETKGYTVPILVGDPPAK